LFAALDARWEPTISWRGGALDRLLDERHAARIALVVELLGDRAWKFEVEVTYSRFGERGSIDVLAWHAPTATGLVLEVKSEFVSVEATLRKLDEKVRIARQELIRDRFGQHSLTVGRLLVLPSTSTERRRVARADRVLAPALPTRGDAMRAWLRRPAGPVRGLLFVASTNPGSKGHRRGTDHRR
jgi:hypothetical protein